MRDNDIYFSLLNNKVLFARYWDNVIPSNNYYITNLPGNKEDISSSCISSLNVGINTYISEEQKKAATIVLEYLFSEEIQREILLKYNKNVVLEKFYDDEKICKTLENDNISISCDTVKKMQSFFRPINILDDYNTYSLRYREIFNLFLYNNSKSSKETLEDIHNISHIYHIDSTSIGGILVLVSNSFLILLMIVSYIFIIQKRNKQFFKFLRNRYWLLFMFGLIIVNSYPFTGLNELSRFKCYIRPILISIGFTISFIPLVLKMIINFPFENKISPFVNKNFFSFILVFVLIDIITFIFYSMSPLVVKTYYVKDGYNFQYCVSFSTIGKSIIMILIAYKATILIVIAFFLFLEWNIEETRDDIRSFISILYINALSMIIYVIVYNINIENHYIYYLLRVIPIYGYTITNYLMVIGIRFYYSYLKKDTEQEILEKMLFKQASYNVDIDKLNIMIPSLKGSDKKSSKRDTIRYNLMNFHFSTGKKETSKNDILFNIDSVSSFVNEELLSELTSKGGESSKVCNNQFN